MPEGNAPAQQQTGNAIKPKRKKNDRTQPPGPTKYAKGAVAEVRYGPVDKAPVYLTSREVAQKCGEITGYLPVKYSKTGENLLEKSVELSQAIMRAYQEIEDMQQRIAYAGAIFPRVRDVLLYLRIVHDCGVVACIDYNRAVTLLVSIETQTRNWIDAMDRKLRNAREAA